MLSGPEILKRLKEGSIVIEPFSPQQLNPNSYNLRLADKLLVYDRHPSVPSYPGNLAAAAMVAERLTEVDKAVDNWHRVARTRGQTGYPKPEIEDIELADWHDVLDMRENNPVRELLIPEHGLVLVPGRLYLGRTVEYTESHGVVPCIEGRSSIGRLGLCTHVTAGFGDAFFKGNWTLELAAIEPLRIYAGVEICQIAYSPLVGEPLAYQGKYQGDREPRPSQLWREFLR